MHAVAPLVKEKLEPSVQGVHTVSDVIVQEALKYVPEGHDELAEQGEQTLSDVVVHAAERNVPRRQDPEQILQLV